MATATLKKYCAVIADERIFVANTWFKAVLSTQGQVSGRAAEATYVHVYARNGFDAAEKVRRHDYIAVGSETLSSKGN